MEVLLMKKKNLLTMNLQFFAEDTGTEGMSSDSENGGEEKKSEEKKETDTEKEKRADEQKTLSDLLKDEKIKAEFELKIAEAVASAKNEAETEASEAEKLAKMTKEEKAAYEFQKKQEDLSAKEAEIVKREIKLEAINQLRDSNIPATLIEIIDLSSAENCKKSIETVSEVFNNEVQAAVNEKLNENSSVMKKASESDSTSELTKKIREAVRG